MQEIIDSPYNLSDHAARLFQEGVRTVIRYYNNKNSKKFPSKCLTEVEYNHLVSAGLNVAVVFQQRGGAGDTDNPDGFLEDFGSGNGTRDATRALALATAINQPRGSAVYFGVDHDFYKSSALAQIAHYFTEVRTAFDGMFRVGVYGSGAVCAHLKAAGLAELFWLPASMGWAGSKAFLASQQWTLFQKFQELRSEFGGFDYDGNLFNPAFSDFGQFGNVPLAEGAPALRTGDPVAIFEVTARSGLILRGGPGQDYPAIKTLPLGTIVHGLGQDTVWIKVDVNGDGSADGFMLRDYLKPVAGGLPLPAPAGSAHPTPFSIAQAELTKGIQEIAGPQDNPRIVLYHASTSSGAGPDETAWCSSFVNYCVTQSGMQGTNSKWARSWHDTNWGSDVTSSPRPGDIVVWRRQTGKEDAGHVAFFIEKVGDNFFRVLGGNQGNCVSIATYPINGKVGNTVYSLLSIRR